MSLEERDWSESLEERKGLKRRGGLKREPETDRCWIEGVEEKGRRFLRGLGVMTNSIIASIKVRPVLYQSRLAFARCSHYFTFSSHVGFTCRALQSYVFMTYCRAFLFPLWHGHCWSYGVSTRMYAVSVDQ